MNYWDLTQNQNVKLKHVFAKGRTVHEGRQEKTQRYVNANFRELFREPNLEQIITRGGGFVMFQAGGDELQAGQELGRGCESLLGVRVMRQDVQGRAVSGVLCVGGELEVEDKFRR